MENWTLRSIIFFFLFPVITSSYLKKSTFFLTNKEYITVYPSSDQQHLWRAAAGQVDVVRCVHLLLTCLLL